MRRRNRAVACHLTYLSLGAGVQSSTLALMFSEGLAVGGHRPPDLAIFADTGDEPQAVYEWLTWLGPRLAFPLVTVQKGEGLREHILEAVNGGRYAGPPVYTESPGGRGVGMLKRQCTSGFKIEMIHAQVRSALGLAFYKHAGKAYRATGYIGISLDEVERMKPARIRWVDHQWPLIDAGMSRQDCLEWMAARGYPRPPKSACRICPYRTNEEWGRMQAEAPEDFAAAVEVDEAIRGGVRGTRQRLYLHESLQPLELVDFTQPDSRANSFAAECGGICGV